MTTKASLERRFKRFKRSFFAARLSFSGTDLQDCRKAFLACLSPAERFLVEDFPLQARSVSDEYPQTPNTSTKGSTPAST